MKKRLSMILGAIALMTTGAASMGCIILLIEEPDGCGLFND